MALMEVVDGRWVCSGKKVIAGKLQPCFGRREREREKERDGLNVFEMVRE